jgi:hypothetical protein
MKGLATRNIQMKYESLSTYQSKVMTKVKVSEKKVKCQDQRVKVLVSDDRSCRKRYTWEI